MIKTLRFVAIFFYLFTNILRNDALSWNETTHGDLSISAAKKSILSSYYLSDLGLENGLDEQLLWNGSEKTTGKWIEEGAKLEDKMAGFIPTRSFNHFHDPWRNTGLDDMYSGQSSLIWAQDSSKQQSFIEGDWSWKTTRDFFYKALTSSTEEERQASFAKTFKGLGHQMHLIQDAGQPDHVRNDAHPEDAFEAKPYETVFYS